MQWECPGLSAAWKMPSEWPERTMAQQYREWGAVRELLPVFNSSSSGFLVRLSYNVNTSELVKRFSEKILLWKKNCFWTKRNVETLRVQSLGWLPFNMTTGQLLLVYAWCWPQQLRETKNSQGHLGKFLQRQWQGKFCLKGQQSKEQLTVERTESIISWFWLE